MPTPKVSSVVEPLPPTSVTAHQGDASAEVQWEASESPSVSSYTVVASSGGASATVAAPATEAVVTGLVNGVVYSFTVTAINAEGPSNPSWVTNSVRVRACFVRRFGFACGDRGLAVTGGL